MFKLFLIFFFKVLLVKTFYIPTVDLKNDTVEEIQNALCTITTKEIGATANATITRQLKGVCTSSELNLKIDKLQTKILQEIDGIKYILELNGFKMPEVNLKTTFNDYVEYSGNKLENTTAVPHRTEEILMYNNTVVDGIEGSTYIYYWKLRNVHQLLRKRDMYKSSPDFQALGHNLRLQFYPNHLKNGYLGIMLRPESQGFLKKHKITILNQLHTGSDINSNVLSGIKGEGIFRVTQRQLETEGFIVQNSIIVRLEIFLNS